VLLKHWDRLTKERTEEGQAAKTIKQALMALLDELRIPDEDERPSNR